jgi:phospholipid-binding lipoprotein MlaA
MQKKQTAIYLKTIGIFLLACQLSGCATQNKQDPLEKVNRITYRINKNIDRVIVKPVARAYEALIPKFVRIPIGNFLQNLSEVPNVGNDLLQGKFSLARHDAARFILNTTWGIGGLLDIAAKAGLERHQQDFGLTMACWGYKNSVYYVIPLFGPSTIRDSVGRVVTYFMGIPAYIRDVDIRNQLYILGIVDNRAALLKAEPILGEAVDEYIFVRDFYLQRRQYQISGGEEQTETGSQPKLEGPPL